MRDRSCLRGIALALVAFAALATGLWLAPAEAQGTSSVWRPTNGSTVQVEPIGFAVASGYQDAKMRNCIATTGVANTGAVNGFLYTQSGAGAPVGVPAVLPAGSVPLYIDTTNFIPYEYSGGAWHAVSATVSLQTAYNGGNTIAEAGGLAVAISSTTADNGNVLTVTKNPAGAQSGSVMTVTAGANTTGTALLVTQSGSGAGISIAGGAGSGALLTFAAGATSNQQIVGPSDKALSVSSGTSQSITVSGLNGATFQEGNSAGRLAISNLTSGGGFSLIGGTDGTGAPATCQVLAGTSTVNGTSGANLVIAGGRANQASDSGGSVSLQTAITGTGTTLVDRVKPNAVAKSLTNNTLTTLLTATIASDDVSAFKLSYQVRVSDSTGHHNQVESGIVQFAAANNNGTVAAPIVSVCGVPARYLESGTLTVTWDVTQSGATGSIRVNVNSSLTATTETVTYTILNDGDASLAVQ